MTNRNSVLGRTAPALALAAFTLPLYGGPITVNAGALTAVITQDGTFTTPMALTINGTALLNVSNGSTTVIDIATDAGEFPPNLLLTLVNAWLTEAG